MEKEVEVQVSSLQESPEGTSSIKFSTSGRLQRREEGYSLVYREQATGMEGVKTELVINQEGVVTLIRSGSIKSEQTFKEYERDLSTYNTPFGQLLIEVDVKQIELSLGKDQGSLFLKYGLNLNNDKISDNRLAITYNSK